MSLLWFILTLACQVPSSYESLNQFPNFPDQFSMTYEHINVKEKAVFSQREYYDFNARLVRFDMVPEPGTKLRAKYRARPLVVVWDFNTGHQYVTDQWQSNCTISTIPSESVFPTADIGQGHVQMMKAVEFFRNDHDNVIMSIHQKIVRGIPCDEWQITRHDQSFHKIYFMDKNWRSYPDSAESEVKQPLIAIEHFRNETSELLFKANVVDFSRTHPDTNIFDVTFCYGWSEQVQLFFKIKGNLSEHVRMRKYYIYTALRTMIAKNAGISPLRVTHLYIYQWEVGVLHVFFTLRNHPLHGNVKNSKGWLNVTQAYASLRHKLVDTVTIRVDYPEGPQSLIIVPDSLKKQSDLYTKRVSSAIRTYSAGSMAGLGIGLLLLGCVFGLLAAVVIYKKFSTKIPYQVTS